MSIEEYEKISVLEPACGSANDYRFIEAFDISRFLDYTGFDLSEKNICNAQKLFPEVNFIVGNAIEIQAKENEYDYCYVHDLFEHLSLEAMEKVVSEISRVTKKGICAGFFDMLEGSNHIVKAVNSYHWNKLSRDKMKTLFEKKFSDIEVIHIDSYLISKYGFSDTHNKGAYTLVATI